MSTYSMGAVDPTPSRSPQRRAELRQLVERVLDATEPYGSVVECSKLLDGCERNEHTRGWHLARVYGDLSAMRREARNLLHEIEELEGD